MPYTADDRATFVTLLPHLAPGGDRDEVVAFVRDHWAESLEELTARPGWDQVRAGLLRVLPDLLDDDARAEALSAAREALAAYPDDVAEGEPTVLVARHPAWVGLAALELPRGSEPRMRVHDEAVALAAAGFAASGGGAAGRGEVLWAMAEQAEEAGWHRRARELLEAAVDSPFDDEANLSRVRLLLGLRLVEDGDDPAGVPILEDVASDGGADERARIHALWVLAALCRAAGDRDDARQHLQRALALVDEEDDREVAARLRGALDDVDDE